MIHWRWAAAAIAVLASIGVVGALVLRDGGGGGESPAASGSDETPSFSDGEGPAYFPDATDVESSEPAPEFEPAGEAAVVQPPEPVIYTWEQRPVGGGGWVKGIEVHVSGAVEIARTDVGGAYRYDRATNRWEQMVLADGVADRDIGDYFVEAVAISASDPDRLYLSAGQANDGGQRGRVLASTDGGLTWTPAAQPFETHGNGPSRYGGERISVHPTNPDEVWVGDTAGLWRSLDGAVTFESVSSVPAGNFSITDQSGVEWVEVRDDDVYVSIAGSGVHRSRDSGASWELLWGSANRPFDAEFDEAGILWTSDLDDQMVRRYDPATGDVRVIDELSGQQLRGLAVSPDGATIVVLTGQQIIWRSQDAGESWSQVGIEFSCAIPWQDAFASTLFTASSPEFDPVEPGRVWVPEGFGVWSIADITADTAVLECRSDGIEELVINDIVVPRSDEVVAASWDRAVFHLPAGGAEASTIGPTDRFNSGWDLATTPADPELVGLVVGDVRFCCEGDGQAFTSVRSFDGGESWEAFGSHSGDHPDELRFGNLAISATDPDQMVWLPSWDGAIHVTDDGGTTWDEIILPGTEDRLNEDGRYVGGSHFQYYLQREVLAADPVTGGRYYLHHADLGFHRSDDGGRTWELVSTDGLPTGWTAGFFNAQLRAVPGTEGHLFYTPGPLNEATFPMFESADGGETWSAVAGTEDIQVMGFGAPMVGDTPTLFLSGKIDGDQGIWRSGDLAQTWELVDETAGGIYQSVNAIAGDPEIPGRVYVGFNGVGIVQGDAG